MTAGVYAIFNLANGFAYVGSSVNVERRWQGRRAGLNSGRGGNRSLQSDWTAAMGQGFEFRVLEVTTGDNDALLNAEAQWIACLRAVSRGLYNVREAYVGRHSPILKSPKEPTWPAGPIGGKSGWLWQWKVAHYFDDSLTSLCGSVHLRARSRKLEDFWDGSAVNCQGCREAKRRPAPSPGAASEGL